MKTKKIDWEEVRAQVARSGESLEKALEPDPAQIAEIFQERARQLALRRRELSVGQLSSARPVQTFRLGEQWYGMEVRALVRILPFAACTRVPGSAPEVLGLINFQGDILVVFELRLLLGLAPEDSGGPGYLFLLRNGDQPFGLRVEELGSVKNISPDDLDGGRGWGGLAGNCEKEITKDRLVILDEEKITQKIRSDHRGNE